MEQLRNRLMEWYGSGHRDLPWRNTDNPYHIWLSEVILQQTRVAQGKAYYERFIERFPDLSSLALAEEVDVLKEWEGLGYYSRARNLHQAAKQVLREFEGEMPRQYNQLIKLKGVGPYTAAAVASIAFGEAIPLIDGNVARVVSRLFLIEKPIDSSAFRKEAMMILAEMMDPAHPGTFNQAIMEFGALQCVPNKPACNQCPVRDFCMAHEQKKVALLPFKKSQSPLRKRFFNYMVILFNISGEHYTLLQRRIEQDIWKHLYEFPLIETNQRVDADKILQHQKISSILKDKDYSVEARPLEFEHVLSHQHIFASFIVIRLETFTPQVFSDDLYLVKLQDLSNYPMSKLMLNFLKHLPKG